MATGPAGPGRWGDFERLFNDRIRSSERAWISGIRPVERIAIVEELFATALKAHERAGDWSAIDARAWADTLDDRRRFVAAFETYGEARNGRPSVADAG